jgi:hypothetical protein
LLEIGKELSIQVPKPGSELWCASPLPQDGTLSGTIDDPDQDTSGILITAITYKEPTLHFESNPSQSVYDGTVNKDNSEITGTLKQNGTSLNLILKRTS